MHGPCPVVRAGSLTKASQVRSNVLVGRPSGPPTVWESVCGPPVRVPLGLIAALQLSFDVAQAAVK
jgi:hypothetical protein